MYVDVALVRRKRYTGGGATDPGSNWDAGYEVWSDPPTRVPCTPIATDYGMYLAPGAVAQIGDLLEHRGASYRITRVLPSGVGLWVLLEGVDDYVSEAV